MAPLPAVSVLLFCAKRKRARRYLTSLVHHGLSPGAPVLIGHRASDGDRCRPDAVPARHWP